jgi:hypothetical protein
VGAIPFAAIRGAPPANRHPSGYHRSWKKGGIGLMSPASQRSLSMFVLRAVMGCLILLVLSVAGCGGGDSPLPSEQQAIGEEIKSLKGAYFIDKKAPDEGIFSVNLSGTAADDAQVARLAEKVPKLKHLKLNATKITNASVNSLKKLKNLATLDIGNTKITTESFNALRAALPKAEINWNVSDGPPSAIGV